MNARTLRRIVAILFQGFFVAACSQSEHPQNTWLPTVTTPSVKHPRSALSYQIAPLPTGFVAVALNNRGAVLGYMNGGAVYYRGTIRNLPPLKNDNVVGVSSINDRGTVVGESANQTNGEPSQPVVWERGRPHPLRTAEPYNSSSYFTSNNAAFINDRGQIVGSANVRETYGFYPEILGTVVFYSRTQLPQRVAGCCGAPESLNNHGEVAGYIQGSLLPPENFGFLSGGANGCTSSGVAGLQNTNYFGLNDRGHVIAQFNGGGPYYAGPFYLFCRGKTVATLQGTPVADNDRDYIIGSLGYPYIRTPQGQYYNLNDLLPAGSPPMSQAFSINDKGEILAYSGSGSATVTYLLEPAASCRYLFR